MIRNFLRIKFPNFFYKRVYPQCNSIKRYFLWTVSNKSLPMTNYLGFGLLSFIYAVNAVTHEDANKAKIQTIISEADKLFNMGKFEECFSVLKPFKNSDDVEVIWRVARVLFNLSKEKGTSKAKSKELILDAYNEIERALKLDDNNYAVHKWMAILHDAKCGLEGQKARLKGLLVFKEHLMKSIELNPKDATSIYMLGQYMYSLADLSWLQRSIATTLFGEPPQGSFEEAFHYFSMAEEVEPNFYSANLLMLGKTCLKLKKLEAAYFWLKCASAYPVRTDEDEAVRLEAQNLLNGYSFAGSGIKTESSESVQ